jgi:hypothetical protein
LLAIDGVWVTGFLETDSFQAVEHAKEAKKMNCSTAWLSEGTERACEKWRLIARWKE